VAHPVLHHVERHERLHRADAEAVAQFARKCRFQLARDEIHGSQINKK
jgi:hypothetical protein